MFPDEYAVFSCDDMNKIKAGPLAVSRYHQIEKFFPTDDTPNYPDHDFPVPGYHLIPSGIVAPVDVSPSNECILEPSLNDYITEANPQLIQSPETINLDDDEHCPSSDSRNCSTIDLTAESDSESQQFVPGPSENHRPDLSHHTLSDSLSSLNQTSDASTQFSGQFEAHSSIAVDSCGRISVEAVAQGPLPPLPNLSADTMCSVVENSKFSIRSAIVMPSSVLSSSKNGCTSNSNVSSNDSPISSGTAARNPAYESSSNTSDTGLPSHGSGTTPAAVQLQTSTSTPPNDLAPTLGEDIHCTDNATSGEFSVDKLGREHYKTSHTDPAYIYARSAKFYSSTCQTHANDMLPQLKVVVREGRTAVVIIVDGCPDWTPASLLNNLFFFRLWRDAGLDMLVVCSYAARYSAYNPIEHL